MARPRKRQTTAEQIQQAEAIVLKRKTAYDEAVALLKELREKEKKENQEALLKAVASSKWSYEKIMEFIQSDPDPERSGRSRRIGIKTPTQYPFESCLSRSFIGSSDFMVISLHVVMVILKNTPSITHRIHQKS